MKTYLTPNEVAQMLMVSPITVRQWAQRGELPSLTTPGGHRRFLRADLTRFAKDRGLTLLQSGNKLRVLIVDDDPQFRKFLREYLSLYSGQVELECAVDGFDAGVKVMSFRPHVMLLDLVMPGLDGFEVCTYLQDDPVTRSIRIIAMTGFASAQNMEKIIKAGAEVVLAKPIDTNQLIDLLGITRYSAHPQP